MNGLVPNPCAGSCETVPEGFFAFVLRALEEVTLWRRKARFEKQSGIAETICRHLQKQVMLIFIAILLHFLRQMIWEKSADPVHDLVTQMARNKFETAGKAVEPALEGEQPGQPAGSQIPDGQKDILTVLFSDIERTAVHILGINRQIFEMSKHVAADLGEFGRVIRADVKEFGLLVFGKSIEANGENHDLPGAT